MGWRWNITILTSGHIQKSIHHPKKSKNSWSVVSTAADISLFLVQKIDPNTKIQRDRQQWHTEVVEANVHCDLVQALHPMGAVSTRLKMCKYVCTISICKSACPQHLSHHDAIWWYDEGPEGQGGFLGIPMDLDVMVTRGCHQLPKKC